MSTAAVTARETHRDPSGRFGTQPAREPSQVQLGTEVRDHLGAVSYLDEGRWGYAVRVDGPVVRVADAIPGGQPGTYLNDRWHRVQHFMADRYGAHVEPADDGDPVGTVALHWNIEAVGDYGAESAREDIASHAPAERLVDDLCDGTLRKVLTEHLARTDELAEAPRDLDAAELDGKVSVDPDELARAVASARNSIRMDRRLLRPSARRALLLNLTDTGRVLAHAEDAWMSATTRPEGGTPFARVDQDGHATVLSLVDAPCLDCGVRLGHDGSSTTWGSCVVCTGEADDPRS